MPGLTREEPDLQTKPRGSGPTRIFISYSHFDGRDLALRLQQDLTPSYDVWVDTSRMPGGVSWSIEIENALDACDVVLALLTDGSYRSEVCRGEQIRSLRRGKCVIPALAQPHAEIPIYLEGRLYRDFSDGNRYPEVLQQVVSDIEARHGASLPVHYSRTDYSTVPPLPLRYVARPGIVEALRRAVIGDGSRRYVGVTGLRGMGGIGKTVLAQAICCDEVTQAAFPDGIVWVSVGQKPGDLTVQMQQVAAALGESTSGFDSPESSVRRLRAIVHKKAVLVVLDDVWEPGHVEAFRAEAERYRIVFTTRDARIAAALGALEHTVDLLDGREARDLLARYAAVEVANLPPEADELVSQCGRLPLALAMAGALVRSQSGDWDEVLRRLKEEKLDELRHDVAGYPYPDLAKTIQVSVNALGPKLRRRYYDLAVFPEDVAIPESALAALWHCGARDASDSAVRFTTASLASRDSNHEIALHDLQRDFVRLRGKGSALTALHQQILDGYWQRCPKGWASGPNDGYFHKALCRHLAAAGRVRELKALLLDFAWVEAKLEAGDVTSLIRDYDLLIDDPEMKLVQSALGLSAHIIAKDARQAASQLVGRLLKFESPGIASLIAMACAWRKTPWLQPETPTLAAAGGPLQRTLPHEDINKSIAITADGLRIAYSTPGQLNIYDLTAWQEPARYGTAGRDAVCLDLSWDGRWALTSSNPEDRFDSPVLFQLWDLQAGLECKSVSAPSVRYSAGSIAARKVFSASYTVTRQEEESDEPGFADTPDSEGPESLEEDSAAGGQGGWTLQLRDLETGVARVIAHCNEVTALTMDVAGRIGVSGNKDGTLNTWDLETRRRIHVLRGHRRDISSVAISADCRCAVSAGEDQALNVWDLVTGKELFTLRGHTEALRSVAVNRDGTRAVSGAYDKTVKVWDLVQGTELGTLHGHTDWVRGVAVNANGSRAVSASHREVKIWDLASAGEPQTPPAHASAVKSVAVSSGGLRALSASADGTLNIWDLKDFRTIHTVQAHSDWIRAVAISEDGRRGITASDDCTLKVWDLDRGEELHCLRGHTGWVRGVAMSGDGKMAVSVSHGGALKVWDLSKGTETFSLTRAHLGIPKCIAMTPDGSRAVAPSDDYVLKVWDPARGSELHVLQGLRDRIHSLAVNAAGRRGFTASERDLEVWELDGGIRSRAVLQMPKVSAVAISADGRRGVSVSADQTVKLWDLESLTCLATFWADDELVAVAGSPDLKTIMVGEVTGIVHFLRLVEPADAGR